MSDITREIAAQQKRYVEIWSNRTRTEEHLASIDDSLESRGVRMYSSLLKNGRIDLMSSIYPATSKFLGKKFEGIALSYCESAVCPSYNLNKAASGFASYLSSAEISERHPWLSELADYEYLELEVLEALDERDACEGGTKELAPADYALFGPRLTGVLRLRDYKYPVPELEEKILNGEKLPRRVKPVSSHNVVFRDANEDCIFIEIDAFKMALIKRMAQSASNYADILRHAVGIADAEPQEAVEAALAAIDFCRENGIIRGDYSLSAT